MTEDLDYQEKARKLVQYLNVENPGWMKIAGIKPETVSEIAPYELLVIAKKITGDEKIAEKI